MEIVLPKNCVELSRTELITTNGGNSTSGDPNFIGLVGGGGIKITGGGVAAFLFGSWIGGVIDGICIDITDIVLVDLEQGHIKFLETF